MLAFPQEPQTRYIVLGIPSQSDIRTDQLHSNAAPFPHTWTLITFIHIPVLRGWGQVVPLCLWLEGHQFEPSAWLTGCIFIERLSKALNIVKNAQVDGWLTLTSDPKFASHLYVFVFVLKEKSVQDVEIHVALYLPSYLYKRQIELYFHFTPEHTNHVQTILFLHSHADRSHSSTSAFPHTRTDQSHLSTSAHHTPDDMPDCTLNMEGLLTVEVELPLCDWLRHSCSCKTMNDYMNILMPMDKLIVQHDHN